MVDLESGAPPRRRESAAAVIGILGAEDSVVRPLLGSLLRSAGYGVRFFGEDEPDESLAECALLLLAPGLDPARKQAFLPGGSEGDPPILELVKSLDGIEVRAVGSRIRPDGLKELRRDIEAALLGTDPTYRREAARR